MTKIHFRPYNPNQTVLFPQRIDEDIAANAPVRMIDALVESLNLESFSIDGTKIESKANKYTFVWRKTVERNRERLMKKIHVLLEQIDDVIVLVQPSAITYKL